MTDWVNAGLVKLFLFFTFEHGLGDVAHVGDLGMADPLGLGVTLETLSDVRADEVAPGVVAKVGQELANVPEVAVLAEKQEPRQGDPDAQEEKGGHELQQEWVTNRLSSVSFFCHFARGLQYQPRFFCWLYGFYLTPLPSYWKCEHARRNLYVA